MTMVALDEVDKAKSAPQRPTSTRTSVVRHPTPRQDHSITYIQLFHRLQLCSHLVSGTVAKQKTVRLESIQKHSTHVPLGIRGPVFSNWKTLRPPSSYMARAHMRSLVHAIRVVYFTLQLSYHDRKTAACRSSVDTTCHRRRSDHLSC